MNRRITWTLSAFAVSLLIAVVVPSSRAQVVRISKGALLLPRTLLSLPPRVLGSALLRSSAKAAATEQAGNGVITGASYHNDTSPALRDMVAVPIASPKGKSEREANENPKIPIVHKNSPDGSVVQNQHVSTPNMPTPILNFDGIPFPGVVCNCAPPDTDGEVGADAIRPDRQRGVPGLRQDHAARRSSGPWPSRRSGPDSAASARPAARATRSCSTTRSPIAGSSASSPAPRSLRTSASPSPQRPTPPAAITATAFIWARPLSSTIPRSPCGPTPTT